MKPSSIVADIYFKLIPLLNDKYEEYLKENLAEDKLKDVLNNNIESKEIAVENISS